MKIKNNRYKINPITNKMFAGEWALPKKRKYFTTDFIATKTNYIATKTYSPIIKNKYLSAKSNSRAEASDCWSETFYRIEISINNLIINILNHKTFKI